MSWQGKPNFCWVKMIDGKRYKVTARQLGFSKSERSEAKTLEAANAWWEAQRIPVKEKEWIPSFVTGDSNFLSGSFPSQLQQIETRIEHDPSFVNAVKKLTTPPTGKTVQHWADTYLAHTLADKKRGEGRYDNLQRSTYKLVASVGADAPVTSIDWAAWDKFELEVKASDLSQAYQCDILGDCKKFTIWLEIRDIIPPVKNLKEKTVKVEAKAIEHFTKAELRDILSKSEYDKNLHCFLLLFANCGFRQSDVATVTPSMIKDGYLTRKRAKSKKTNAPTVSWILWAETLKAIEKVKSKGELLFVRKNGLPWIIDTLSEKKRRKRDDVFRRELWKPFNKDNNWRLPSDKIRGSCANLLKTDSDRTNQLSVQIKYMGHKPSGVALRHYIDPPQEDLNAAVMSLREMLL